MRVCPIGVHGAQLERQKLMAAIRHATDTASGYEARGDMDQARLWRQEAEECRAKFRALAGICE